MHPILRQPNRSAPYLVSWLFLGLLLAVVLGGPTGMLKPALALILPWILVYAFVCLAAWYPVRAHPLVDADPLRALTIHFSSATLSSGLWLALGWAATAFLVRFPSMAGVDVLFGENLGVFFAVGVALYLLAVGVHYLIETYEASRRAESRALELKLLAQQAELETFKTQIDPHFLFNCLNSISSLCGSDPEAARRAAIRLGDFLRASLRLAPNERIALERELDLAESYLDVERIRFGDRLAFESAIAEDCLKLPVPALLLQPLLENALKHGIAHLVEGGTVRLEAESSNGELRLVLTNPCDPERERDTGTGIGLSNVRGRLRLLYDGRARLHAEEADGRYSVDIRLPVESLGETP